MTYRIRFHPLVERDLRDIVEWVLDYAGSEAADRTLTEIERTITGLAHTPHMGSIRDETAPGLRAIPAGRKAVVAFTVDDKAFEVLIHAVTYAGADWVARMPQRQYEK